MSWIKGMVYLLLFASLALWEGESSGRNQEEPVGEEEFSVSQLQEERRRLLDLKKQLEALQPKGLYIVIDTGNNRLYLKKKGEVLLAAVCSTGSGRRLEWENKEWTFRTPRGQFRIQSRTRNPVWKKPDWAFIEEGQPVPVDDRERFEKGVLGEYALGIGDGYFIHGTLYTRLLGVNVTHGCIRLGDADLAYLANSAPIGTPVYIF